jgi:putative ABC transport system ATP-binding protein
MSPVEAGRETSVAVACRGVTKVFGTGEARVEALRGVELEVPLGQLTMLVGPSGCGKTTLLSVIAGLLDRTAGEIQVLGVDTTTLSGSQRIEFRRKHLGFVFQQHNLLPALTAAENAAVPLLVAGMNRRRAVAEATTLLEGLGRRVGEVSAAANGTGGCLPPHRPERAELPHSVPQT